MPTSRPNPPTANRNEGEGSRTAARAYNKATQEFVADGKVEAAAEAARKAVDSPEKAALTAAEKKGLSRARH